MKAFRLGFSGLYSYDSVDRQDRPIQVLEPEQQLSFKWRVFHATVCVLGSVAFFLGSTQYFPSRNHHFRGSMLYTWGAAGYFVSDFLDFWLHHRFEFPLVTQSKFNDFTPTLPAFQPSYVQWLRKHESSLNSLLMAFGSLFYFVGCILFIPQLRLEEWGDIIFIPGSCIIIVSESWSMYRAGCIVRTEDGITTFMDQEFRWENVWKGDQAAFYCDLGSWIGGVLFLIGSVWFLPEYDKTDNDTDIAAMIFVIGSLCFLFSACCLCVEYFFTPESHKAADADMYARVAQTSPETAEKLLPETSGKSLPPV
jgi:hypothetical protein